MGIEIGIGAGGVRPFCKPNVKMISAISLTDGKGNPAHLYLRLSRRERPGRDSMAVPKALIDRPAVIQRRQIDRDKTIVGRFRSLPPRSLRFD